MCFVLIVCCVIDLCMCVCLHVVAWRGSQYPSIAEEIKSVASADPVHRKLFVRGLAWNTTSETLCAVSVLLECCLCFVHHGCNCPMWWVWLQLLMYQQSNFVWDTSVFLFNFFLFNIYLPYYKGNWNVCTFVTY